MLTEGNKNLKSSKFLEGYLRFYFILFVAKSHKIYDYINNGEGHNISIKISFIFVFFFFCTDYVIPY